MSSGKKHNPGEATGPSAVKKQGHCWAGATVVTWPGGHWSAQGYFIRKWMTGRGIKIYSTKYVLTARRTDKDWRRRQT